MSERDIHDGNRGKLLFIADILYDYDGYESSEKLKELIDEVREIALEQYRKDECDCKCKKD